jgi:hypothetical protein
MLARHPASTAGLSPIFLVPTTLELYGETPEFSDSRGPRLAGGLG